MTHVDPALQACVQAAVARVGARPGSLLEVLHAVQEDLRCVPAAAVPLIAEALNLTRAEVHGVLTFYHHFRGEAPGSHVVQLCRAEACLAMRARELEAHVRERLGVDFHETSADGRVTLEPVYCLGNCACAPAMLVDGELHGRVTPEAFDALLRGWRTPA
jgi:formate dehydrogenase subunit gamma